MAIKLDGTANIILLIGDTQKFASGYYSESFYKMYLCSLVSYTNYVYSCCSYVVCSYCGCAYCTVLFVLFFVF